MNSKALLFMLTALLLSGCKKDVPQHDTATEIQQGMLEYHLPALSAGIIKGDSVVWAQYYGYRNLETGAVVDAQTIYHLGSISKLFILTAVMQLEEQGKIDLDEDISSYLPIVFRHPQFPNIPITPRMLLTHTTGLAWPKSYNSQQGMWNQFDPDTSPAPSEWVPQYLIPGGQHYDASLWKPIAPGAYERYSNIGICVAAYAVEQISGQNFRQYCQEHIFTPLDMQHTSYNYAGLQWDDIAVMYSTQGIPTYHLDDRVYAAGGAKSTIRDLGRFVSCILNKGILDDQRILQEQTVDKILEVQNPATGRCLAWKAYPDNWFGHLGGLDVGTATTLVLHPGSQTGIILFTNTPTGTVFPGGDLYWLVKQKANSL